LSSIELAPFSGRTGKNGFGDIYGRIPPQRKGTRFKKRTQEIAFNRKNSSSGNQKTITKKSQGRATNTEVIAATEKGGGEGLTEALIVGPISTKGRVKGTSTSFSWSRKVQLLMENFKGETRSRTLLEKKY